MKIFCNNTLSGLVTFIVALQILNMSIDAPFVQKDYNADAQNINYIDTYVEYFAEVIFKYSNVIPETGNRRHKELQQHHHLTIVHQSISCIVPPVLSEQGSNIQKMDYKDIFVEQFINEINPPPPKLS